LQAVNVWAETREEAARATVATEKALDIMFAGGAGRRYRTIIGTGSEAEDEALFERE